MKETILVDNTSKSKYTVFSGIGYGFLKLSDQLRCRKLYLIKWYDGREQVICAVLIVTIRTY